MTINALRMINLRARNRTGGDCVVLALTFITGASYLDVEDTIKQHHFRYMAPEGKRAHGVITNRVLGDEFKLFGITLKKFEIYSSWGDRRINLAEFQHRYPKGTFLVSIFRHVLVIQDGQQFDACDSKGNNEVLNVWIAERDVAVAV